MEKFDYFEGFCPKLGYKGLWPCRFAEKSGKYIKQEMSCSCRDSECFSTCPVFDQIPDIFPQDKEWLLKDVCSNNIKKKGH